MWEVLFFIFETDNGFSNRYFVVGWVSVLGRATYISVLKNVRKWRMYLCRISCNAVDFCRISSNAVDLCRISCNAVDLCRISCNAVDL